MSTRQVFYAILSLSLFLSFCSSETVKSISTDMAMTNVQTQDEDELYEADWVSLNRHTTPQWLRDGKFGIYTHWGVYSVHAMGDNATWYVYNVYNRPDSWQRKDFESKYGKLSDGVGYKDLIPMFKAEKFDAAEWADLFARAGAKFAGPVAEHHDGFAMWDTRYSDWNAAKMGPKRDIVGELEKAIKARDMKFVTTFHHSASWFYFPVWDERYDSSNPEYSGLYGFIHEEGVEPTKEFLDHYSGKVMEVIDKYDPDFIWFESFLELVREDYYRKITAYYYNNALKNGKEVVLTYKDNDIPPLAGLTDLEGGQEHQLTHHEWITDTDIDVNGGWGYVEGTGYKSVNRLVDNLVDRVSKNGYLLLNVGPKADGTIPEEAAERLLGMGEWLDINGEAIYGTSAWIKAGEGPSMTSSGEGEEGGFRGEEHEYTPEDIRFTVKGDTLYAIVLDWPGEECLIKTFNRGLNGLGPLYENEIEEITMLGDGQPLEWKWVEGEWTGRIWHEGKEIVGGGLSIETPAERPGDHAYVFKIVRKFD